MPAHFSLKVMAALFAIVLYEQPKSLAQQESSDDVRAKLEAQVQFLSYKNYGRASADVVEAIVNGAPKRFPLRLDVGAYAIVGVCGGTCDHVQLSIYGPDGALLVVSPDKQPVVVISGAQAVAGDYSLQLATPGCKAPACQAGFVITRYGVTTRSEPAPALAAPQRYRVVLNLSGGFLSVRQAPSADSNEVGRLPAGTGGLTKLSCVDGRWCRVARDGRELGYVNATYLVEEGTTAVTERPHNLCHQLDSFSQGRFDAFGFGSGDVLNIRAEPNATAVVLGQIAPSATDIEVGSCGNGWCIVRHDGVCGWASSRYLRHSVTKQKPAE